MADLTSLGSYQIIETLRRGSSADTYLAEHVRMRTKRVLLRVLNEATAADEAFVRDFVSQARAAAKLQHDCIASVIDLESEALPIYTVLEFIEGMDLGSMLSAFGPTPPEVAATILCEVCRGLDYAHAASVLHGRLRPRLVKLTPEGRVKILGFGVREKTSMIEPTALISDVAHEELYRSPEQVREEAEGPASDLYSCGVIFFELLTGRQPFTSLAHYVAADEAGRTAPRVRDVNPLVPPALAAIVEHMLADKPGDRPASAGAVRRELEAVLEERGDSPSPDLVQAYLVNPPDYATTARRRVIAELMHQAEGLARGPKTARATALRELELILTAEPGHAAARALAGKLRTGQTPAPPNVDPFATQVLPPAPSANVYETQVLPPSAAASAPRPAAPAREDAPPRRPDPPPPAAREQRPAPPPREAAPMSPMRSRLGFLALVVVGIAAVTGSVLWSRGCRRDEAPAAGAPVISATGSVAIRTLPAGARVSLAGSGEVRTGDTTFGNVPAGECRVHAELPGFAPRDTTVAIVAGQTTDVVIAFVAAAPAAAGACSLYVQAVPGAERVLVDDVPLSGGPELFAGSVAPGRHRITAFAEGYLPWSGRVETNAKSGPRVTAIAELKPKPAEPVAQAPAPDAAPEPAQPSVPSNEPTVPLAVQVKPASDVLVDGVVVASRVSDLVINMPQGTHEVSVVNPDFVSVRRQFNVRAGNKLKTYRVDLTSGSGRLAVSGPRNGLKIFVDDRYSGESTPGVVSAGAGAHMITVREWNGTTIVGTQRVIVDPARVGSQPVVFTQ